MMAYVSSSGYTTIQCSGNYTTTGNTLYPEFWVMKDLDQNGVADDWELPLAEKFCPTLKLHHPTEWVAPEPVEIMNSKMYYRTWNVRGRLISDSFEFDTEGHNYSDYTSPMEKRINNQIVIIIPHFEWAGLSGNDPDQWIPAYQDERNNNHFRNTIYAHFFWKDCYLVIQYWFFYPYNDGWNNHEGDWEHINVLVSSQNPATASIQKIDFYFHHKVKSLSSGYQLDSGTHPIVYVGGSCAGIDWPEHCQPGNATGGSYPWSGTWANVGTWGYDEYVWGAGPTISYTTFIDGNRNDRRGIVILPEPDKINYDEHPEMSWLKADIAWGHVRVDSPWDFQSFKEVGNDAPGGPYHNPGWNKTGAVSGAYENY